MPESEGMTVLQMLVLAVVQGATEYIPISSSGHLVLVRELFHWSDEHGIAVDVVLHAASILAVLMYFWRDWVSMFKVYTGRDVSDESQFYRRLPVYLFIATLPLILFAGWIEPHLGKVRNVDLVAAVMIATAIGFVFAERMKPPCRSFGWSAPVAMGLIQLVALLPGASRSGLTTAAGLMVGLERTQAARFAFLMAFPAIAGAIVYEIPRIEAAGTNGLDFRLLAFGFGICLMVSLACIHVCLKLFKAHSLRVFSVYLAVAGLILIVR